MKQYNKMMYGSICFFVVLILVFNLICNSWFTKKQNKYYQVELNRMYSVLYNQIAKEENLEQEKDRFYNKNQKREILQIEIIIQKKLKEVIKKLENNKKSNIECIEWMSHTEDVKKIEEFYQYSSQSYVIKPLVYKNQIIGYFKFYYKENPEWAARKIQLYGNLFFIVIILFFIGILYYLQVEIIQPFHKIVDMPYQLAKGHLTKQLLQNKSQFFRQFLWGLDMLREHLEQMKQRELQLEKEKKTILLSISHDIKTPLSAIQLYTKALLANLYKQEEKRNEVMLQIIEKTNEIERFVKELIESVKEDFLEIEVKTEEFYLKDLMKEIEEYYQDKLKLLKIVFDVGAYKDCLLYGDKERMREVVENIIENAIKYGDGKKIALYVAEEEQYILIQILNSGNTLPKIELVHMFESFWRGSNVKDKKGSGLGLFICRHILQKMEGEIFAEIENDSMIVTIVIKRSQ